MTWLKGVTVCCGLVALAVGPAWAELKTTNSALACLKPDKLQAAEEAARRHDRAQMDMLGCFPVSTGTVAKRIDGDKGELWHVVLDPNGPQPMEVWARPASFHGD